MAPLVHGFRPDDVSDGRFKQGSDLYLVGCPGEIPGLPGSIAVLVFAVKR